MSESGHPKVEWKLDALLRAGRQAKQYALHPLDRPTPGAGVFAPWQPQVLRLLPQPALPEEKKQPDAVPPSVPDEGPARPAADPAELAALREENQSLRQQLEHATRQRFEEGLAQGRKLAADEYADRLMALQSLGVRLESAQLDLAPFVSYLEQLALTVARAAVRQVLLRDEDHFRYLVQHAISLLPLASRQDVQVFLSPQDLDDFREALLRGNPNLELRGDPDLERGDLRLASGHTEVEDRLLTRLETALAALTHHGEGDEP